MKKQRFRKGLLIALAIVAVLVLGAWGYLNDYSAADDTAQAALTSTEGVTVRMEAGRIVFMPRDPKAGFIFYPGGKVDTAAYAPLMHTLADNGVLCVALDMPFRLAVLNPDAAQGVTEDYPEVTRWSIGGHSLGGAMAAKYAAKAPGEFDALILLAAYAPDPLPQEGLAVVSVYGSKDTVLNADKYAKSRVNLPESLREVVLEGGNHAQFGAYGAQDGDGEATLSAQEQLAQTVAAILPAIMGSLE